MEPERGGIENSKSVRDMHHLRLMSLLQEQVRDHGRKQAAEILGVDRRTLDAALDQGMLTPQSSLKELPSITRSPYHANPGLPWHHPNGP